MYDKVIQLYTYRYIFFHIPFHYRILPIIIRAFPDGSVGKESSVMWETRVQSLGWEDPLEIRTATHFIILAWRTPWTV